jgi:hypothetical protein
VVQGHALHLAFGASLEKKHFSFLLLRIYSASGI